MRIVGAHLAKFFENLCLVLRRDPDPGIADRKFNRAVGLPGANSDPSSLRREFHCVGEQIKKDLFDLALIADEIAKTLVYSNIEVDAMLGSPLPHKRACIVD